MLQLSPLQASEEFDVPRVLLCITTTLSLSYVQKESRWECCRSDGPLMEGGVVQGVTPVGGCETFTP